MGETVAANLISTVNALCLRSRQETFSLTLKLLFCENVQLVLAQFFCKNGEFAATKTKSTGS